MVAGQKAALGRCHADQTVTVMVSGTTLAIEFPDGDTRVIRRTTTQPVRSIKGQRPRTATPLSQTTCRTSPVGDVSQISCRITAEPSCQRCVLGNEGSDFLDILERDILHVLFVVLAEDGRGVLVGSNRLLKPPCLLEGIAEVAHH
jgi:hypothetical protein